MSEIFKGHVKWFNDAKGFGFIEHESGRDVFVHYSVIEDDGYKTLKDGEEVQYTLSEGDKGLHAQAVTRVNAPVKPKEEGLESAGADSTEEGGAPLESLIEIEREGGGDPAAVPVPPSASDMLGSSVEE